MPPSRHKRPLRDWEFGDLVLAKVKGYRKWPAQVKDPVDYGFKTLKNKVFVFFFGSNQVRHCLPSELSSFTEKDRNKLLSDFPTPSSHNEFSIAVHQICMADEKGKHNTEKDVKLPNAEGNKECAQNGPTVNNEEEYANESVEHSCDDFQTAAFYDSSGESEPLKLNPDANQTLNQANGQMDDQIEIHKSKRQKILELSASTHSLNNESKKSPLDATVPATEADGDSILKNRSFDEEKMDIGDKESKLNEEIKEKLEGEILREGIKEPLEEEMKRMEDIEGSNKVTESITSDELKTANSSLQNTLGVNQDANTVFASVTSASEISQSQVNLPRSSSKQSETNDLSMEDAAVESSQGKAKTADIMVQESRKEEITEDKVYLENLWLAIKPTTSEPTTINNDPLAVNTENQNSNASDSIAKCEQVELSILQGMVTDNQSCLKFSTETAHKMECLVGSKSPATGLEIREPGLEACNATPNAGLEACETLGLEIRSENEVCNGELKDNAQNLFMDSVRDYSMNEEDAILSSCSVKEVKSKTCIQTENFPIGNDMEDDNDEMGLGETDVCGVLAPYSECVMEEGEGVDLPLKNITESAEMSCTKVTVITYSCKRRKIVNRIDDVEKVTVQKNLQDDNGGMEARERQRKFILSKINLKEESLTKSNEQRVRRRLLRRVNAFMDGLEESQDEETSTDYHSEESEEWTEEDNAKDAELIPSDANRTSKMKMDFFKEEVDGEKRSNNKYYSRIEIGKKEKVNETGSKVAFSDNKNNQSVKKKLPIQVLQEKKIKEGIKFQNLRKSESLTGMKNNDKSMQDKEPPSSKIYRSGDKGNKKMIPSKNNSMNGFGRPKSTDINSQTKDKILPKSNPNSIPDMRSLLRAAKEKQFKLEQEVVKSSPPKPTFPNPTSFTAAAASAASTSPIFMKNSFLSPTVNPHSSPLPTSHKSDKSSSKIGDAKEVIPEYDANSESAFKNSKSLPHVDSYEEFIQSENLKSGRFSSPSPSSPPLERSKSLSGSFRKRDRFFSSDKNQGRFEETVHVSRRISSLDSIENEIIAVKESMESMLDSLTRTKDSICKTSRHALECARLKVANQVVDSIVKRLEGENNQEKRITLFFLLDNITQTSIQKGDNTAVYPELVEANLPRILSAAAPPGKAFKENRKQCLKVLKLWLSRSILPDVVLNHFIDEIEMHSKDDGNMYEYMYKIPKTERAMDDPMLNCEFDIDEYGSNTRFEIPGLVFSFKSLRTFSNDSEDLKGEINKEKLAILLQKGEEKEKTEAGRPYFSSHLPFFVPPNVRVYGETPQALMAERAAVGYPYPGSFLERSVVPSNYLPPQQAPLSVSFLPPVPRFHLPALPVQPPPLPSAPPPPPPPPPPPTYSPPPPPSYSPPPPPPPPPSPPPLPTSPPPLHPSGPAYPLPPSVPTQMQRGFALQSNPEPLSQPSPNLSVRYGINPTEKERWSFSLERYNPDSSHPSLSQSHLTYLPPAPPSTAAIPLPVPNHRPPFPEPIPEARSSAFSRSSVRPPSFASGLSDFQNHSEQGLLPPLLPLPVQQLPPQQFPPQLLQPAQPQPLTSGPYPASLIPNAIRYSLASIQSLQEESSHNNAGLSHLNLNSYDHSHHHKSSHSSMPIRHQGYQRNLDSGNRTSLRNHWKQ